jgi:hypothetical protein
MKALRELYRRHRAAKWPKLAGTVGDFGLYDSLVAGVLESALTTGVVKDVPEPDDVTLRQVAALREAVTITDEEREFLEYFNLLGEISEELKHLDGARQDRQSG